ncbi:MAG: glycosyltransferase family 1 protein [Burkholderiaceae bacterium]|nr:MAG: glycosyltransferase family 1 protein [Burkholderiaceae bacterium]
MKLVISAVNLVEGGTLTVLRDAKRMAADLYPDWTIHVLVHSPGLAGDTRVDELAFPDVKRSWLRRLQFEWFDARALARRLQPDVWLSLQDITARIDVGRQYVYCQNPSPFCTTRVAAAWLDPKFVLFRFLYGYLYGAFIHRNAAVIVQQDWTRRAFVERYGVSRVIVAHPVLPSASIDRPARAPGPPLRFVYPAFPRVFKNFEVVGDALALLERDEGWAGEVVLTIDGTENRYARRIRQRYGHLRSLRFAGLQDRAAMAQLYRHADALLFPSLLETWGLPLSEAKAQGLPILAADLPYARESVGRYGQAAFFDPQDSQDLAARLRALHRGEEGFTPTDMPQPAEPFADGWPALLARILGPARVAIEERAA